MIPPQPWSGFQGYGALVPLVPGSFLSRPFGIRIRKRRRAHPRAEPPAPPKRRG